MSKAVRRTAKFIRPISCLSVALLLSCAPWAGRVPAKPAIPPLPGPVAARAVDYIELRPGWRLRVTTPLLKSGAYQLQAAEEQVDGNTVVLDAAGDFEGYETAFYAIGSRPDGSLRIDFISADVMKAGKVIPQLRSKVPLFRLPYNTKFVRLIYLTRVSKFDHDMAVVAAAEMGELEKLTKEVQTRQEACQTGENSVCFWVPAGIAVVPETLREVDGALRWAPVQ